MQVCQVFFCASGLGPAKHLCSRSHVPAFLTYSSTAPISFMIISPAHLFRVFSAERGKGTSNPWLFGQVCGKAFISRRKSGSLCEGKQFALIRKQATKQEGRGFLGKVSPGNFCKPQSHYEDSFHLQSQNHSRCQIHH